jgi:type III secretory pathway component EscT
VADDHGDRDRLVLGWLVLGLRGAAAILVLTTLVGGIPRLVQGGLAGTFGAWTALVLGPSAVPGDLVAVEASELALGAALGLMAAVPLIAAQTAGRLVDIAGQQKTYATLFGVLAAAVFVGIDGHVAVVTAIVESHVRLPAVAAARPAVMTALASLVPAAVGLAVPWLVTVVVGQIAIGAGVRVAGKSGTNAPVAVAIPTALVMITASLVSLLAISITFLIRKVV